MPQGIENPGRPKLRSPRGLIGMSFSRVILSGLLSSRARLRFPGRCHSATASFHWLGKTSQRGTVHWVAVSRRGAVHGASLGAVAGIARQHNKLNGIIEIIVYREGRAFGLS